MNIDATRAAARRYLERGWTAIAYAHESKAPKGAAWQKKTCDKIDVDKEFSGVNTNVGIVLGKPSGNLVDVDLDCTEALQLANHILPETPSRFGRAAKPDSHRLYVADVPATMQWGSKDGMIVELRSTGGQTMFPPSVHPSGEVVTWNENELPAVVDDADELIDRCHFLAFASLILRNWLPGKRNMVALRMAGALLDHGWTEEMVKGAMRLVAEVAGDKPAEVEKALRRVDATVKRRENGRSYVGLPKLAEVLEIEISTLRDWIDRRPQEERGILKSADPIYVARQFARTLDAVYHWRGDFYRWSGSWWERLDDEELRGRLYRWLEGVSLLSDRGTLTRFPAKQSNVADILSALAGVRQLPNAQETPFWIDPRDDDPRPSDLLPFRNGVLDLTSFELVPPDARLFSLHGVDCEYDANATAPTWQRFMADAFPNDPDSISTLHEILGYCLADDTSQQKAFALLGEKRSGKGTIGRILRAAVGAARYVNPTMNSFGNDFGTQNLIGKSVATISDSRGQSQKNPHTAVEYILSITGEDSQSIQRKFKSDWNGTLPTRIFVMSNLVPKLKDPSGVIVTRFIVINFQVSFFGREDPKQTEKLLAEMPGIINAWLAGLRRLRERGHFVQPASGIELLQMMDENAGTVRTFVDEMCVVGPEHDVTKKALFYEISNWLKDRGHRAISMETFAGDLYALHVGIKAGKARRDAKGYQEPIFRGITLKEIANNGGKMPAGMAVQVYRDSVEVLDREDVDGVPF